MFVNYKIFYNYVPKLDLSFFSGYIGYLILGYYLRIKTIEIPKILPFIGYVLIVIFTACATKYMSESMNRFEPLLYNYLFFNTALAAAFLFIAIKNTFNSSIKMPNWLMLIDKYSFSIYLIHILPLNYIHPWVSKYMGTLMVIPTSTVLSILASILIAYILQLIPGGKNVTGIIFK